MVQFEKEGLGEKVEDAEEVAEEPQEEPKSESKSKSEKSASEESADETPKFEWQDSADYAEETMKKKAASAEDKSQEQSEEELNKEIEDLADAGKKGKKQLKPSDIYDTAYLVIELIDSLNMLVAKLVSKEKSSKQFELEDFKKKKLAKALTAVFYKLQVRLGPAALLILMSILYLGSVQKNAFEIRMRKKEEGTWDSKKKPAKKKNTGIRKKRRSAIVDVLKKATGPMTQKEIADAIKPKFSTSKKAHLRHLKREVKRLEEQNRIEVRRKKGQAMRIKLPGQTFPEPEPEPADETQEEAPEKEAPAEQQPAGDQQKPAQESSSNEQPPVEEPAPEPAQ